jgi:tetratricopeptide (TPR) repeat protein
VSVADPGSARPGVVAPARAFLIFAACAAFAAAAFLLARVDHAPVARPLPGTTVPTAPDAIPDARAAADRLRTRPADGAAFRVLGDDARARGDRQRAQRLYAIAVRRNPRDARARLQLVDAALARDDAAAALRDLDAAMRVAPGVAEPVLRRLLDALGQPAFRAALAARLATDPPWRERLPALLQTVDPVATQALLAELAARPLPPAELALRMALLEAQGHAQEARAAWSAALPNQLRRYDGRLFDGGFETAEGPAPYGWKLPSAPEALVGLDTTHVAQGRSALAVLVQGRAVVLPDVSQRLVLAPGRYLLVLRADSALTGAGRSFAWVLSCNAPEVELARVALPRQTRGWQRFSTAFAVPSPCATQTLRLVHEGRNLSERTVSGRLGVDAMQLLPVRG